MAAIDSLLRVITSQNADALTLAADQIPKLSRAGLIQPLSMPPIPAAMIETFVGEVLTSDQIVEARGAPVTVDYGEFAATVSHPAAGWTMAFKKRPPPPRKPGAPLMSLSPISAPAPVVAAAPAPPPPPAPRFTLSAPPTPPPPAIAARWLARTLDEGGSDLLLSSGRPARLRVAGELVDLPGDPLDDDGLHALLDPHLGPAHRQHLERHGAADLSFTWHDGDGAHVRFRVNVFRQSHGLAAAFRPIRRDPPTLASLDLPDSLTRLVGFPNGLVLVVGPTGSGKSTTLVALLEHLNRTVARHVLTLEDPIEYELTPQRSLFHQRELGTHVDSFEAGLRSALREAPDVIFVGEMRDRATISAALTAAETGHLVLSTLHAAGAAMAVERIVDAFPEHQQRQARGQIAGVLRAVLTQHLLPRIGGGRVPAIELALVTAAVGALIRDGKTHQLPSVIQTGRDDGMVPLDRSLADRVERRQVTLEAAAAVTSDGGAQLRELLGLGRARR